MTRRHVLAVAVSITAMLIALAPPLWVRTTGTDVALALRPVDPLSLFRGNYVDLNYDIDATADSTTPDGNIVFVVFDDSRPARVVDVTESAPDLDSGQTCVRGRSDGGNIGFPELEQFFVTADEGRVFERDLDDMVGIVRTTGSCRAILVAIEPQ